MHIPEELTSLALSSAGKQQRVVLRVPTVGEVMALVLDPDLRMESLVKGTLAIELQALIDTIDGEVPSEDQLRSIVNQSDLLGSVLHVRRALYNFLAEQGRAMAYCPHCTEAFAELDLIFYWMRLRLPVWELFDRGVLMHPPSLASALPNGSRPSHPPCASRLEFHYPSEPQLRGMLRSLQTPDARAAEEQAWQRWVPPDFKPGEGQSHWRRNSTGFRATLRLSVALDSDWTPGKVEEMPIGAFVFLDLLHFATTNVDVPDASRLQVKCPKCEGYFLPVLSNQ